MGSYFLHTRYLIHLSNFN